MRISTGECLIIFFGNFTYSPSKRQPELIQTDYADIGHIQLKTFTCFDVQRR